MAKPGLFAALLLAAALAGGSQLRAQPVAPPFEPYSQAELDQLLAHVALYPDELLSHVLIAATYPLEVVEAARWTRRNPGLAGDVAVAAAAEQDWAPAVTALVAFPEVLQRMDEDLEWTQRLGDAVLVQEAQVMDTVQSLRQRAWTAGSLGRLEHVNVRREREVIYIEPVRREIIHVPYYNPVFVYGPWWHPAHPPWFWTPVYWGPGYRAPAGFYSGVTFWWGSGITVSTGFLFSRPDWYRRHLVVVQVPAYPPRHRGRSRATYRGYQGWSGPGHRWRHDPQHRRGVAYSRPLPPHHVAPGHSPRVIVPSRPPRGSAQGSTAWQRDPRRGTVDGQWRQESRPGAPRRDEPQPVRQRHEESSDSSQRPGSGQRRVEAAMASPRQLAAGGGTPAGGTRTDEQRLRIEQRLRADGWQRPEQRPRQAAAPPPAGTAVAGRTRGEQAVRAPAPAPAPAPAASRLMPRPPEGSGSPRPGGGAAPPRLGHESRRPEQPRASAPMAGAAPVPRATPVPQESREAPATAAPRGGRGGNWSGHRAVPEAAPERGVARRPDRGEPAPRQGRGGDRR